VNSGTGIVQRSLETNIVGASYRHYASPVQGETVNTLATNGYSPDFSAAVA
jgi:hypothetical protein